MGAVRDNNFFVVHGWMINQLGLKGNELQLYAIIYGFSQAEGNKFKGSLQYLSDWTGLTRQNTLRRLQSLVEKGLLIKRDIITNGVKTCEYHCSPYPTDPGMRLLEMQRALHSGVAETTTGVLPKQQRGVAETTTGVLPKQQRGVAETATNNISDKDIDKDIDNKEDNTPHTPKGEDVQERRFAAFWEAYPKKVGKEAARKAWRKVKPDAALHERILLAIDTAKGCDQWCRENGRFIPNPATWLNQGRWDDEPTQPIGTPFPRGQAAPTTSNPFLAALNEGVM